jgi:hypothetical protein
MRGNFMKNDKEEQALKNYIDVTLEEYKALRNESRQCSANTFTVLYIGFVAIGVLFAAGFPLISGEKTVIGLIIFGLFIPIIALGISFLILTEAIRLKRIGDYICFIEIKLSSLFKEITQKNIKNWTSCQKIIENKLFFPHVSIDLSEPLIWERWLRCSSVDEYPKKKFTLAGHLKWAYVLRIGLFAIISFLSFVIAAVHYYYMIITPECKLSLYWIKISIIIFLFMFYGLFWVIIYRIGQKITKTSPVNMNEKDN